MFVVKGIFNIKVKVYKNVVKRILSEFICFGNMLNILLEIVFIFLN